MNEFFAFTTADGETVRLPFPADLPLDERDDFMAAAIAAADADPSSED
ncbi:MAG: hypothetical protein ACK5X3_17810 [Pseudomonadota bacterium]|jgi:hypothetical protein